MKNFRFSQQRAVFIPYVKWKKKNKFFIKSATKRLLAYRYGARKGNLNFFWKQVIKSGLAVPIWSERRKKFWKNDGNSWLVDSVLWKEEKHHHFVFKQALAVECWCEKMKILCSQLNNLRFPFPIWCKENISFYCWQ